MGEIGDMVIQDACETLSSRTIQLANELLVKGRIETFPGQFIVAKKNITFEEAEKAVGSYAWQIALSNSEPIIIDEGE